MAKSNNIIIKSKKVLGINNPALILNGVINNGGSISNSISTITYNYGVNGMIGFTLESNNTIKNYYYIKNIFNDVIEIIDDNYNTYAKYAYDIFGKWIHTALEVTGVTNIVKDGLKSLFTSPKPFKIWPIVDLEWETIVYILKDAEPMSLEKSY